MSLEGHYDATGPDADDAGPLWRAEWAGDEGTISTGALPDDFNPHNFDAVLTELGYTPGEVRMELVSATRWEQRTAIRDADGRKTGEWERAWLNAYRYKAQRNALMIDLPALYADVKASRPGKHQPDPTGRTAVVCWADIQTGKVDHGGGVSELLERLEAKRGELKQWLKATRVEHVVVADVGDIVEGFENIPSQTRTNGLSLQDQVDVAATEFWRTIKLCEKFGPVDVLSIPSNHCQWRKGRSLVGKPNDDWGIYISKRLEQLNAEAGLRVDFHRPPDDWKEFFTFPIQNNVLGLAHGHQANSPDRTKKWWETQTHYGLDCDILLTGHFHFPSFRPSGRTPDGRVKYHIQASTLDNGSSWVANKYGEDGDPALTVFAIDAERGLDVQSYSLL